MSVTTMMPSQAVPSEYNHSDAGALKFLIDSVYDAWQAKPVAFVSYGRISGGLRAVEQLRLVFAEPHAVTIRHSVSFANVWEQFDAAGKLLERACSETHVDCVSAFELVGDGSA